jgi:hypothetical protein
LMASHALLRVCLQMTLPTAAACASPAAAAAVSPQEQRMRQMAEQQAAEAQQAQQAAAAAGSSGGCSDLAAAQVAARNAAMLARRQQLLDEKRRKQQARQEAQQALLQKSELVRGWCCGCWCWYILHSSYQSAVEERAGGWQVLGLLLMVHAAVKGYCCCSTPCVRVHRCISGPCSHLPCSIGTAAHKRGQ